jgi:hypothetical protein
MTAGDDDALGIEASIWLGRSRSSDSSQQNCGHVTVWDFALKSTRNQLGPGRI